MEYKQTLFKLCHNKRSWFWDYKNSLALFYLEYPSSSNSKNGKNISGTVDKLRAK